MEEFSFPRVTGEIVSARIQERLRSPRTEELSGQDLPATVAGPAPLIDTTKVQYLVSQALRKLTPSGWRSYHRVIRRQSRVNESIVGSLGELVELVRQLNVAVRRLQERVEFADGQAILLQEKVQRLAEMQPEQIKNFEDLYFNLQERIRGTDELLRKRLAVYLPYLAKLNAEGQQMNVLDLGCGRGEWLGLLKANGYRSQGIDINARTVAHCTSLGLNAAKRDLLEYLRNQKEGSFNVITAFHVIEHLRFHQLVELLDQTHRVLTKGGMVIFETSNPESIISHMEGFYTDPTHSRPVPARLFQFLAEARGFSSCEVLSLQPVPAAKQFLSKQVPELASALNLTFYRAQDYAIIARKGS